MNVVHVPCYLEGDLKAYSLPTKISAFMKGDQKIFVLTRLFHEETTSLIYISLKHDTDTCRALIASVNKELNSVI